RSDRPASDRLGDQIGAECTGHADRAELADGERIGKFDGAVPEALVRERLSELSELQDAITARKRDELIGNTIEVLVDAPGVGRSHREAPEIDGIVELPDSLTVGEFRTVRVTGALGPDLIAEAV
ncbi:MAG: ribosomal protein methylthiotransferase RimO, partial [Actinomycetota bacterium]